MTTRTSLRLTPEDRLELLRASDSHRKWTSLDDARFCPRCHRVMMGRQIEITRTRGGEHVLHCATVGCGSGPAEWIYATAALHRMGAGMVKRLREQAVEFSLLTAEGLSSASA